MIFLDEVIEGRSFIDNVEIGIDDLNFLELSGRQTKYLNGNYGNDIVVAVIDSGVSPHPEFEDRLLEGRNFNSQYNNPSKWQDDNKHGTHVAATIAGKNVGIAPKAKILPIKVLDAVGGVNRTLDIIDAIKYAREWRGKNGEKVSIISMSLSSDKAGWGSAFSRLETEIKSCVDANILVVCSSGNTSKEEQRYPSAFNEPVCVGAVDVDKKLAKFSTIGNQVDVCQIGVNVLSAYYTGGYIQLSGTSMSTPIISGMAALLAREYKVKYKTDIPEPKLYEALKINTKDLGIVGVDKQFGAGFVSLQPLDIDIKLIIGDSNMYINGKPVYIDSPPILYNNRFYLPLRWLLTYLGGYINYDHPNQSAIFRL